jgi:hypothetical protein
MRVIPCLFKELESCSKTLLPVNATLEGVQMLGPGFGWAVGRVGTNALILRYDGTRWDDFHPPYPYTILHSSSMTSSGVGWIVGSVHANAETGGILLHPGGVGWWGVSPPVSAPLLKVRMFSASEGWAIGSLTGLSGTTTSILLHYHGGVWSNAPYALPSVTDIAMTSPDNGWAVGNNRMLAHYQNGTFTQWSGSVPGNLVSVRMLSASDGWAVGNASACACAGSSRPFAMHYDGSTWTAVSISTPNQDDLVQDLALVSPTEAWAVGQTAVSGLRRSSVSSCTTRMGSGSEPMSACRFSSRASPWCRRMRAGRSARPRPRPLVPARRWTTRRSP